MVRPKLSEETLERLNEAAEEQMSVPVEHVSVEERLKVVLNQIENGSDTGIVIE